MPLSDQGVLVTKVREVYSMQFQPSLAELPDRKETAWPERK